MKRAIATLALLSVAALIWCLRPSTPTQAPLEPDSLSKSVPAPDSPATLEAASAVSSRKVLPAAVGTNKSVRRTSAPTMPSDLDSIVGVVVRRVAERDRPIPDAEVSLMQYEDSVVTEWVMGSLPPAPLPLAQVVTPADGTFKFERLAIGRYRLRARLRTGEEQEVVAELFRMASPASVCLVFGSGQVHGVVHAIDGAPIPGLAIRLMDQTRGAYSPLQIWRHTGADGEFRFAQVPAGNYDLLVGARRKEQFIRTKGANKQLDSWPSRRCTLTIVEGDDLAVDVGSADGARSWIGRIQTPGGDPYGAGKTLRLQRQWRSPRGSKLSMALALTTNGREAFALHVEPGDWHSSVTFAEDDTWQSPKLLLVRAADLEDDIEIPGTLIAGTVRDSATGRPLLPPKGGQQIRIRRFMHEDDRDPDHNAVMKADGSYSLLVHGDGDWVLSGAPVPLSSDRNRLDVAITASEGLHQLDLEVRRP